MVKLKLYWEFYKSVTLINITLIYVSLKYNYETIFVNLCFFAIPIIFIYKKSRSLRSQDSAPGKKILTCFGALPARTHSSGGGQSTAVRPEFCPVCVHSPTTEVCMKQVFPNQRHRGALLSLNFPPSWWIGWLHYIPIYPDCQ